MTGPGPTQNASSACRTCSDCRSASLKMATVETPSSWQARLMRSAISPRLAMRTLRNIQRSIAKRGWPYSTGWPSVTKTALTRPAPRERTGLRMPSVST